MAQRTRCSASPTLTFEASNPASHSERTSASSPLNSNRIGSPICLAFRRRAMCPTYARRRPPHRQRSDEAISIGKRLPRQSRGPLVRREPCEVICAMRLQEVVEPRVPPGTHQQPRSLRELSQSVPLRRPVLRGGDMLERGGLGGRGGRRTLPYARKHLPPLRSNKTSWRSGSPVWTNRVPRTTCPGSPN